MQNNHDEKKGFVHFITSHNSIVYSQDILIFCVLGYKNLYLRVYTYKKKRGTLVPLCVEDFVKPLIQMNEIT